MLRHLHITNFAILSDVTIDLEPGFNVFTGETGAGKSLIVDAVSLLRGARASSDIPREGAKEAVVEAVFEPPDDLRELVRHRLEEAGLPCEGDLVIRRVISRNGRSRVHINGALTTSSVLQDLGKLLVDLSGQHEHQGLCDPSLHGRILDAFGVDPTCVNRAEAAYESLKAALETTRSLEIDERERAQREDYLRFQLEEIDAARLAPGEEEELELEVRRLRSVKRLVEAAGRGEEALYAAEGAVVDVLTQLGREIQPLAEVDPRLAEPARQIEEARVLCEDAAMALRRYASGIADDPQRLAELEDRLDLLRRLCRKHGASVEEILARRAALAEELEALLAHDSRRQEAAAQLERARVEAKAAASALTEARRKAGATLVQAAAAALAELGMKGAALDVVVEPRAARDEDGELVLDGRRLGPRGWDRVELLLAANKGEAPRPLHKIASGGELSRIMLALKMCLRNADAVGTYVFDEVDAGIGGGAAEIVGRQIQKVARTRQVICVTHLPQIAALADAHFRVEKYEEAGRTETRVERLGSEGRKDEVARMLGGLTVTARTRAAAQELLTQGAAPGPGQRPARTRKRA